MAAAPKEDRRVAICDAVFELLGEVGYDRMSMDAVAARARASKATIYRKWQSKPDLVTAALLQRFADARQTADTGSLRGDLVAHMSLGCEIAGSEDGAIIAGLMTAAARDPELAATVHTCIYATKRSPYETILNRAIERGELPAGADVDLLHETVHALIINRRLSGAGPMDDAFVERAVDRILLPVLRSSVADPA